MHVISFRRLREFFEVYPDAEDPLKRWFKIADKANWVGFGVLKASCPSADQVGHLVVVNIGGNKYRLIIEVFFEDQVILIRQALTHKVYDKGEWKLRVPAPKKEPTQDDDAIERKAKANRKTGERERGSGK